MKNNVEVLCHSSIRIEGSKIIYIDPFEVSKNYNDADYIFCTHSHYDHFSKEDIEKVIKEDTIIITVEASKREAIGITQDENKVLIVEPDKEYKLENIRFKTTYAYNKDKDFHPKANNWVGYIINMNEESYYIAGDTDNIDEIQNVECDVAFIPVGGTYTMDYEEAAHLANTIDAKIVIPTHYGSIVGKKEDGEKFAKLVNGKEVLVFIR